MNLETLFMMGSRGSFCISYLLSIVLIGSTNAYWAVVWEDNFDDGDNRADKWDFETKCDGFGNNELQCYNGTSNVRQENGIPIIEARREANTDANNNRDFTSAKLKSKENWLHGKFEIRARLPKGKHLWPAIWMLPRNTQNDNTEYGTWPRSGEIDILEYRGQRENEILGTIHMANGDGSHQEFGSGIKTVNGINDFSQDFHTYEVDWSPSKIKWSVDGNQFHEESLERNFAPGLYSGNGKPFDKNFYLIINLAVGGNFFPPEVYGVFDSSEAQGWAKNTLEIDWVRKSEWR